jgi:hypothetical protein
MTLNIRDFAVLAGSACLLAVSACNHSESPTGQTLDGSQPKGSSSVENYAPEGRKATDDEVARIMAARTKLSDAPLPPVIPGGAKSPVPLAKASALSTCTDDFNQSLGLSLIPDHCFNTFAVYPYYIHQCNSSYWVYSEPLNLDHFHLMPEVSNQCYGTSPNWGTKSGSSCINQSDAKLWPRRAANMGTNTGVRFYVKGGDNVHRNFNLGAIYASSGTLDVWAYRVGVGWWHWNNLTSPGRWYFPVNNTNISEVQVFENTQNGTISFDNLEINIIP